MAQILSTQGLHFNVNDGSTPNAGHRIYNFGKIIPGNSTWIDLIRFTNTGGGSAFSMAWTLWQGVSRSMLTTWAGHPAENWWHVSYYAATSLGSSWTQTSWSNWIWDGNGITNHGVTVSGNYIAPNIYQSDSGAYSNVYMEVYCSKWDQITVTFP